MKAKIERIEPAAGSSFLVRAFADPNYCNRPRWHCHPEYEIVYISNGRGKRHIGDHISYYEDGDLIFLGPDLPHFGFTEELYEQHVEIVLQMKEDFLGESFLDKPEMLDIRQMFQRSRQGISFYGDTKREVGELLKQMPERAPFERLLMLLSVLQKMALSNEYRLLGANGFGIEVNAQDQDRMRAVYFYVEENFKDAISLAEVARRVNMTIPAFCRYFKRLTNKTFIQFVNEYRVAHASRMLSDESLSISVIGFESGFNNISHFNKQFREIMKISPRDYRKKLRKIVA
jgi:AraC-like DNA-binding protein